MKRLLCGIAAVVLLAACNNGGGSATSDDETITSADQLIGRWREIGTAETRVFLGDGTTSVSTAQAAGGALPAATRNGTYRLVSPGTLEIQMQGEAGATWGVSFGHVGEKVLRMKAPDGRTHGFVDESTVPGYAPTTAR